MSRVSSVVFGCMVLGVVSSAVGCKVTVETKNRYTTADVVPVGTDPATGADPVDWKGEPIVIDIQGAGVIVNGGVNVTAASDPSVTKISVRSRILAMAFAEKQADAQLTLDDIKKGFVITHAANEIRISCPHGATHGDSVSGESGCELTNIVVPQGTDLQKLDVKVLSGNGDQTLQFGSAKLKSLTANANGAACDINAQVGPSEASVGAVISLVSNKSGDVTLRVPSTFAANKVFLVADAGKTTNAFPDITATDGTVGRGAAGSGFAEIKLTSVEFAGSTGTVNLAQ